jgi:hypothetical protein
MTNIVQSVILIGIGATLVIDAWGILRRALFGIAPPSYALVGRWLGHMPKGRFRHDSIAAAPAIRGEAALGWSFHYLTGIAYAGLLVALAGPAWLERPAPLPALAVGLGTVVAPFFLMQPGMGAGIAASRSPNPSSARLHSLLMHAFFGLGLYLAALAARFLIPSTGA